MDILSSNKQNTSTNVIPIFSMRMAGYLMLKGFVCFKVVTNNKTQDGKFVYLFKRTEKLQDCISYLSKHRTDIINDLK